MPGWNTGVAASSKPGPASSATPQASDSDEMQNVLVEMLVPNSKAPSAELRMATGIQTSGFRVDSSYEPIPMGPAPRPENQPGRLAAAAAQETVIIRGTIPADRIAELEAQPNVVKVWKDTKIAPFASSIAPKSKGSRSTLIPPNAPAALASKSTSSKKERNTFVNPTQGFADCPIGVCDCDMYTAKGTLADVANYLRVDEIWAAGHRGEGIVVGVVDGGITALGRPVRPNEIARIDRVIGGFPVNDWGTTGALWGQHGNMCATDVLGMAPNANLYDIRISEGAYISIALAGFTWAINQHRIDGTPHILTNSWGIFQEAWDPEYARDPNHPFTRKVVEAVNEGIIVLFSAGNCGATCPDERCGPDTGPGRCIWGANGHPRVITVGGVNIEGQLVGYSGQGPAALDPNKPDFCSVTHFQGYFAVDAGTSAATPVAAGVIALLKQAKPGLTPDQVKDLLKSTAKRLGPGDFNQHAGAGIIRAKVAYDGGAETPTWGDWENLGGFGTEGVAAAARGPNTLEVFTMGKDRRLVHSSWNGTVWSAWQSQDGPQFFSSPAAVSLQANHLSIFAIGGDRAVWQRTRKGSWGPWHSIGGFSVEGVAACARRPNQIDCFVVGTDRAIWHRTWSGSAWGNWENLGGEFYESPAAVSSKPNRIDVFGVGVNNSILHKSWDGNAWSDWEDFGGFSTEGLAASSRTPDLIDCFSVGIDRAIWRRTFDGSIWKAWEKLGGQLFSVPAAVSWGPERIDVFGLSATRAIWHRPWE